MDTEGRGLPHWDMFKRRLWRTPGRWAIMLGLVWIALTLWFPRDLIDDLLPRTSWYLPYYSQIAMLIIGLLGYSWLYYMIAQGMSQLADTGGSTGWYSSTMRSTTALNGVLLTTLVQSSVGLVGLLAFTSAQLLGVSNEWEMYNIFAQLGGDLFNCYPFTVMLLLRLPHYALFCACLSIALRNTSLGRFVPLLCTLAGTAATFVPTSNIYFDSARRMYYSTSVQQDLMQGNYQLLLPLVGALLLLLVCFGLVRMSHRGLAPVLQPLVIAVPVLSLLLGAMGIAIAFLNFMPNNQGSFNELISGKPILQLAHAFLSHVYPNLLVTWTGADYNQYWGGSGNVGIFGLPLESAGMWILPLAGYLLSLAGLYLAALACLNGARYPALPMKKLLSR